MNEQEQLKQLQKELDELKATTRLQQEKINQLQQRIWQLTNVETKSTPQKIQNSNWSLENFIGLRLIQFIGIIVLVIGLSIGVKYAIDRNLISEMMRISLAYAAGVVLYLLSLRLRKKYTTFSAILFSGAMASLYFTTYAAYVYYNMFSSALSFIIMVALTFYAVYEAIRYDRQEIALLGLVGAYGIPFLISKNSDRADLFFLYISLINAGVVFLCIKKLWKNVGRVAEVITWILFVGWSAARFNVRLQHVGLFFMAFFFLLFLFTTLSYKIIHKHLLTKNDIYQIAFNNLALYIGVLFVFGYTFVNSDLAFIMLILSIITAVQTILFNNFWKDEIITTRLLTSLSLILFVLFVGFNWSGFIVTLLWLLTAVIIFTWGFAMKSVFARMMAIVLIGITLAKLIVFDSLIFTTVQKVIAYLILGILLLLVSFFYQKFKQKLFEEPSSSLKEEET